jgi:hypothetical protein
MAIKERKIENVDRQKEINPYLYTHKELLLACCVYMCTKVNSHTQVNSYLA